uniref:Cytochrome c oxidase subunit 3 n=1 Tax=Hypochilus thorelli TaxID=139869 RepID=B2CKT6_HYPTH|nr:cytochrome c oxidase subunit III [Hypochilus thorelli]ACA62648.1 cytochrome oxidase subunit 3 [Hypochilus thorelli]
MLTIFHPYHIVSVSPWPLLSALNILLAMLGLIKMFLLAGVDLFYLAMISLLVSVTLWWRDVIRESTFHGEHTLTVMSGLMIGMLLFILSEVFFFLSFFWAFFHSSLSPSLEIGSIWPPTGLIPLDTFQVPLLNTVILLGSGVSVTWAHQSLLNSNNYNIKLSLMLTWLLGAYFLFLQYMEYKMAMFSISDSVFGSVFFVSTGFHGIHVMIGSLFLMVMWLRVFQMHFSSSHHFGFEAAAWYWHFVDVVWLFLFSVVYWWGG